MPEYATIQQHQPLRVPQSFDRQGKALVLQLDEVFDDIYRRFGRLRLADMGKEFRKQIADDEGNIADLQFDLAGLTTRVTNAEGNIGSLQVTATALTGRIETAEGNITTITADVSGLATRVSTAEGDIGALEVRAGNIEISVANKYDKVSGIAIESPGITISGSNYVKIQSGCSLQIKSGGTFTVESGNFAIEENGNVYINGSGYFSGELIAATGSFSGSLNAATGSFAGSLSAATGTFAGTMSAACITSGTMSANRISGGSIDARNVTITNLNASNITSGTMSASKISGGSIDATNVTITNLNASNITSGTLSASKISGGTLVLGGIDNINGTLQIKNSSGTVVGTWDKDGLSYSGSLSITSGGSFDVDSDNLEINSYYGNIIVKRSFQGIPCYLALGTMSPGSGKLTVNIEPQHGSLQSSSESYDYYFMQIESVDKATINGTIRTALYIGTKATRVNGVVKYRPVISGYGYNSVDDYTTGGDIEFQNASFSYAEIDYDLTCRGILGRGTLKITPDKDYSEQWVAFQRERTGNKNIITILRNDNVVDELRFAGNANTATRLSKRPTYGELSGRA